MTGQMDGQIRDLLDRSMRAYAEREARWWKNDRRGRWVVLEPSPARLLKDCPPHIREYLDLITERRGRRFSSLSRARAFAHEIGGEVRRWRRRTYRRYLGRKFTATWRYETNPWARVTRNMPLWGGWMLDKEDL